MVVLLAVLGAGALPLDEERGEGEEVEVVEEEGKEVEVVEEEECTGDRIAYKGGCWQLASTGPCGPGRWLVLQEVAGGGARAECQGRRCKMDQVWWATSCSCLAPPRAALRAGAGPCGEGGQVLVSPYGEGLCGCRAGWELGVAQGRPGGDQGLCRRGSQPHRPSPKHGTRIIENLPINDPLMYARATRLTCWLDEAGNCRKPFGAAKRRRGADDITKAGSAEELITWLGTFEKQEEACTTE